MFPMFQAHNWFSLAVIKVDAFCFLDKTVQACYNLNHFVSYFRIFSEVGGENNIQLYFKAQNTYVDNFVQYSKNEKLCQELLKRCKRIHSLMLNLITLFNNCCIFQPANVASHYVFWSKMLFVYFCKFFVFVS